MAMKAKAASDTRTDDLSARLPIRSSASNTITSTAALMPNNAPSIGPKPRP